MINPYANLEIPHRFYDKDSLSTLMGRLNAVQNYDDVYINTDRSIVVKSEGKMHRLSRVVSHREVESLVNIIGRGENIAADILRGEQLDTNLRLTYNDNPKPLRYRVNAASKQNDGKPGIRIVLRSIKTDIPGVEFTKISQELFEQLVPKDGLVLFCGETGSGKTTSIASVLGHIIRKNYVSGFMVTYEQPIEYYLHDLVRQILSEGKECSIEVDHHDIGVDLPNFTEAVKNALRINPDILLIGELRDKQAMDACIQLALSGHLVYSTLHAASSLEAISRIVSAFDSANQDSIRMDLGQAIKAIVVQKFATGRDGGRVMLREVLTVNRSLREKIRKAEPRNIPALFEEELEKQGTSMKNAARNELKTGRITEQEYKRIVA
jgi:twitching motility protein PilU